VRQSRDRIPGNGTATSITAPGLATSAMPALLSTRKVAAYFSRDERTIRRWVQTGLLTPIRIGKAVYFRADDIQAAIIRRVAGSIDDCIGNTAGSRVADVPPGDFVNSLENNDYLESS